MHTEVIRVDTFCESQADCRHQPHFDPPLNDQSGGTLHHARKGKFSAGYTQKNVDAIQSDL